MFHSPYGLPVDVFDHLLIVSSKQEKTWSKSYNYGTESQLPLARRCLTRAQVPRGCQHYSGCYERPDIHGHANDTAILPQPHFMRADTGLEMKGEASGCEGSAEGVYVFCG